MASRSQRHKLVHQKVDSSGRLYEPQQVVQPLSGATVNTVAGDADDKAGQPSRHRNSEVEDFVEE